MKDKKKSPKTPELVVNVSVPEGMDPEVLARQISDNMDRTLKQPEETPPAPEPVPSWAMQTLLYGLNGTRRDIRSTEERIKELERALKSLQSQHLTHVEHALSIELTIIQLGGTVPPLPVVE